MTQYNRNLFLAHVIDQNKLLEGSAPGSHSGTQDLLSDDSNPHRSLYPEKRGGKRESVERLQGDFMNCLTKAYITPAHIPLARLQSQDYTSQQRRLENVVHLCNAQWACQGTDLAFKKLTGF